MVTCEELLSKTIYICKTGDSSGTGNRIGEQCYMKTDDFITKGEWLPCPVPTLCGVPLLVKRVEPSIKYRNFVGDYLTTDPYIGPVQHDFGEQAFMRADYKSLGTIELMILFSYIRACYENTDIFSLRQINKKYFNKKCFEAYSED